MTKVALSGAGGQVGGVLRPRLLERGVKLRSGGELNPLTPLCDAEEITHGDLREPEVVDRLLQGVDVLIHLAGTSVERPLPEIIENNLRALHEVYEGARRHGVKRIVFASSNHAFGMYSVTDKLSIDAPFRPDGFYGLSKAWGEDMTRMYWDKHGIEGISIRIGAPGRPRPNSGISRPVLATPGGPLPRRACPCCTPRRPPPRFHPASPCSPASSRPLRPHPGREHF